MKKPELLNPNSATFAGTSAAKIGFSTSANSAATETKAAIATSGAEIHTPGPREKTQRIATAAIRVTAAISFQAASTIVACIPERSTPKKKAMVTAWNGRTQMKRTM